MNRSLILWLSKGALKPLLFLLPNFLRIKGGLYSLVLTCCAVIGSGQLVLGQDCGFISPVANTPATDNYSLGLFDESDLDDLVCSETLKTIPIVVHVLLGPEEIQTSIGITEADIRDAVRLVNAYYRTNKSFNAVGHDAKIQFSLAGLDPNGNATTGVVYQPIDNASFNLHTTTQGCERLRFTTTPTTIAWNDDNYINVYIVKDFNSLGIANNAKGLAFFGGEAYVKRSAYQTPTFAHELAHCLIIDHTFAYQATNLANPFPEACEDTPSTADCTMSGDRVCDTPPTSGYTCRNLGENSCISSPPDLLDNLMSYCSDTYRAVFTVGQIARMHNYLALPSFSLSYYDYGDYGGYICSNPFTIYDITSSPSNLWSASNLVATGVVQIDYNRTRTIVGQPLHFEVTNVLSNATYVWTLDGSGTISTNSFVNYTPTAEGTYILQLTTTFPNPNNVSCTRINQYQIDVVSSSGVVVQADNNLTQDVIITPSANPLNPNNFWHNQQRVINGNVIVQQGATLTIDGGVFEFSNYGAIIVQEGGTLIIRSYPQYPTVFKGKFDTNCNRLAWGGIRSWGTVTFEYQCTNLNAGLAATVTPTSPACLSSTNSISGSTSNTVERIELYQADITPSNYTQNFVPLQSDTEAPYSVTQNTNLAATTYTFATKYTNLCNSVLLENAPLVVYKKLNLTQPSAGIDIIEASGTANDGTICSGSTISLTATGGASYNWTRPTGITSTTNPQSFTNASTTIAGLYTVTVTDAAGCTASTTTSVTVYSSPVVSIAGYTAAVCAGTPITLTTSVAGGSVTYLWSNEGAATANYTPNTSVAGTTTYTVTVTNANGCTKTATKTVVVNALPTAAIAGNPSVCAGGTTTITASGGGTYLWSNGATSADITVSAGTYTVTVTNSGCTATASKTVTTTPPPTATITGSNSVCQNTPTTFTASGGTNYTWSNGVNSLSMSPPTTAVGTTTYTVTVTNANGCTNTAFTMLTTSPLPQLSITTSPINECSLLLTANATGGTGSCTYQWWDNSTAQTYIATTAVTAQVAATDANGCQALANITLTYNQVAPANFDGIYTVGDMGANSFATPDAGGNETWTSLTKRISGTIVVPAGKTLTINSSTLTMVGTLTNIVVQPGGRLNLSSSILQADQCSSTYWQGISAKGNAVAYTNADPIIAFGTGNYGLVYATNSTIKNARIGVCNGLVQGSSVTNPGGIISLDNTTFTDCGIALRIAPTNFANQQPHLISNCTFKMALNTPFDANYWHPTELQPIGIWVKDVILPNTLYNNSFESTMPAATTTLDKRGIGMRLDNVRATIDAAISEALEFNGLFKGIDVNNLLTAVKFITIKHQNFGNTRKALTLNNTYGSSVGYCSFAVPPGLTSLLDTYGIMSYYSKGITIDQNTFTTTNQANKHTKGAIFENSTNGNTPSVLTNNLFDGSFEAATQFKDTNAKLSTNCNAYDDCQADWHLTSTANLPEQGACNGIATAANRTHWHYITDPGLTGSNVRIKNSNTTFELKLNIDNSLNGYLEPQSNPKLPDPAYVDGWVTVEACSTNPAFTNNSCVVSWPIAGAAKTETECSNGSTLEQAIYNYLQQDQRDSLLLLLQCIDEEWTQKLLIGTYVDEGQYDLALAEMQKLDSTTLDNAEFIALYTALMDSTLNTTPTEGGRIAMALNQTQAIANNPQSGNKTLAEAVLALCQNADYVRYGDPISFKTNEPVKDNAAFKLIPNPAQDVVTIVFATEVATNTIFTIYDINGKASKLVSIAQGTKQISIATNNLPSGIYYCKLANSMNIEKLIVIGNR
jgi:hypothetical protein